jgi:hypothetical protein
MRWGCGVVVQCVPEPRLRGIPRHTRCVRRDDVRCWMRNGARRRDISRWSDTPLARHGLTSRQFEQLRRFPQLYDRQMPPPIEMRHDKVEPNAVLPSRLEDDSGGMLHHLHWGSSSEALMCPVLVEPCRVATQFVEHVGEPEGHEGMGEALGLHGPDESLDDGDAPVLANGAVMESDLLASGPSRETRAVELRSAVGNQMGGLFEAAENGRCRFPEAQARTCGASRDSQNGIDAMLGKAGRVSAMASTKGLLEVDGAPDACRPRRSPSRQLGWRGGMRRQMQNSPLESPCVYVTASGRATVAADRQRRCRAASAPNPVTPFFLEWLHFRLASWATMPALPDPSPSAGSSIGRRNQHAT